MWSGGFDVLSGVCCVLVIGCAQKPQTEVVVEPLVFVQLNHDFGHVFPGAHLETDFNFTNRGSNSVTISDVKTSCGCTVADLDRKTLQPGESGRIRVKFQVAQNSDPVRHLVSLSTDAPSQSSIQLSVRADPDWPLGAQPEAVHVVPILHHRGVERELELYTASGDSFEIKGIEVSEPWINVRPLSNDGRRRRFQVRLTPTNIGAVQGRIVFRTDVSGRETLVVPVTGNVISNSRVTPSRLLLGNVTAAGEVQVQFEITHSEASSPVKDLLLRDTTWSVVQWTPDRTADRTRIRATLIAPQGAGYRNTILEVLSGDGSKVEIPISCILSEISALAPANAE